MQRTIALTLRVAPEDAPKLERARAAFAAACDWISGVAYTERVFNKVELHHRTYYEARSRFPSLPSQFVVRAVGVVADAYRREKRARHRFRPDAAVVYDARLLTFWPEGGYQRASLSTVDGRIVCPLSIGGYQRALLARATKVGQADLIRDRRGRWRLHLTVTLPDPEPAPRERGVPGIDVGIKNLAVDSDGTRYSGAHVNGLRRRSHWLRKRLQAKGTHSSRRRLRSWKGKQTRFQTDVNHVIAKRLVRTALITHRAIAVEDLNGIRRRIRASRDQRWLLGGWGFAQLRSYISYKAEGAGITVYAVDPRYTSQTCPSCGLIDRRNRPDQATFRCIGCGFAGHADHVAATNISRRGALAAGLPVNQPHVPDAVVNPHQLPLPLVASTVVPGTSSRL
jgi:IS605 OrfB family transposase